MVFKLDRAARIKAKVLAASLELRRERCLTYPADPPAAFPFRTGQSDSWRVVRQAPNGGRDLGARTWFDRMDTGQAATIHLNREEKGRDANQAMFIGEQINHSPRGCRNHQLRLIPFSSDIRVSSD